MSDRDHVNINTDDLARPANFSGVWLAYWPDGKLKYRGAFREGVPIGQHVCFWQDGTVAEICWRDPFGQLRGTGLSFHPDGDKQCEEIRDSQSPQPGSFVRKHYDSNGDLFLETKYIGFVQVDSWESADSSLSDEVDDEIEKFASDAAAEINRLADSEDE